MCYLFWDELSLSIPTYHAHISLYMELSFWPPGEYKSFLALFVLHQLLKEMSLD